MSAADFVMVLRELRISQVRLARLFGSPPSTVSRWALGDRAVPTPVAVIMCALYARLVTMEQLEALAT